MKRRRARPSLTLPIAALIRDVSQRLPGFEHLNAEQILVVAGEARRASHASVRPLHDPRTRGRLSPDGKRIKPRVRLHGVRMLYLITLRPIWFRASTPAERVATLLHELFHISARFDGTLHPKRRHAVMGPRFAQKLLPLVRRYLAEAPPEILAPFAHRGLVRVRMWLEKPPASVPRSKTRVRKLYTEAQLFVGLARMT